MKVMNKLGTPVVNILTFSFIMISGEAFGGPYAMYLLGALPHGINYSMLGMGGILCLLISQIFFNGEKKHWMKPALQIMGILLAILSLYIFFAQDRRQYNYATFVQTVPLLTLFFFSISILCGTVLAFMQLTDLKGKKPHSHSLL
ncbi:hypothetical protein V9K67_20795 [Paraflavisolibacter sp. H34]|uniref:hypothetical protein n=1 Tax=Huijunlia imazamoxiresistens TaxID=3127457 RepID=UPI0030170745